MKSRSEHNNYANIKNLLRKLPKNIYQTRGLPAPALVDTALGNLIPELSGIHIVSKFYTNTHYKQSTVLKEYDQELRSSSDSTRCH